MLIDNNWAENQMRPQALGRKNWLFVGSLRSGQRAAVIMLLIQSARLNELDVFAYRSDVLRQLPTHKDKDIDESNKLKLFSKRPLNTPYEFIL